ncbi:MAG: hypothetical protein RBG13Loki_1169 [Promethearchaeota archaeon CR_4]|nr:MAG: hypothetical protein RBG13Loki_1169 [Candidatus Lokiarchaeota archaeon CR_4]
MARTKYLWLIIGFAVSIAIFATIVILAEIKKPGGGSPLIPGEYIDFFVNFLPGNLYLDLICLFGFPVALVLLFRVIGENMVSGWLKVHHLVHRKAKFGINPLGPKVPGTKLFRRAVFIGLLAFSVTALIVEFGLGSLFRNTSMTPTMLEEKPNLFKGEAIFIGTFFFTGLLIILMAPFWLMEDTGILIYDVRPEDRRTPNVAGVHLWFVDFFEGYAGVSAIISLVLIIVGTFTSNELPPGDPAILTPIILIILPFITSGILTIPIVIYEKYLPKLTEKLQKKLVRAGYSKIKVPVYDQVKITDNRD